MAQIASAVVPPKAPNNAGLITAQTVTAEVLYPRSLQLNVRRSENGRVWSGSSRISAIAHSERLDCGRR